MTNSPWRIVFFGTPFFAVPPLRNLLQGGDAVLAVVTQPDRGKGRGQKVTHSPVKELSLQTGVRLLQPERVKEKGFGEEIGQMSPDLLVVVAYGQILPEWLLSIPRYGAVNVHASLLPKYRGAAPVAWAILNGEKVTGVTTMLMDEGMDTGDILLQREIPIEERETTGTLHDRLSILGADLLLETIEKMKGGVLRGIKQDSAQATVAPLLKKEDGRIDWSKEAGAIDRQVRGFYPWPGAYTRLGADLLKIHEGEPVLKESGRPRGTVVWTCPEYIEVGTGNGVFHLKEVQLEGKKRMKVRDFLLGHPVPVGASFS